MPRSFADWPLGQLMATAIIANIGIALLVVGVPPLSTALRASRATTFECDDDSLQALRPGDWVRLTDCDTDMFHQSGLADGNGQRTHTLMPLREHERSVDIPSDAVLAVPREQVFAGTVKFTSTDIDAEVYRLAETIAVVVGPLDWLPAIHQTHEEVESGIADGAQVLELRAIPELRAPATATAVGSLALLFAGVLFLTRPIVRWWMVGLALVLALVAGLRMLQWYADPMRGTLVAREEPAE
jgi:hypothetical protein